MLMGGLLLGLLCSRAGQHAQSYAQQTQDDPADSLRYHSQITTPLLRFFGTATSARAALEHSEIVFAVTAHAHGILHCVCCC
jgi:ornithine cyclodeaminase/alanine dehydrogenase-like protein (mu-crystallin family)